MEFFKEVNRVDSFTWVVRVYGMEIFEIAVQTLYILSLGGYLAGSNPLTKPKDQIQATALVVGEFRFCVGR